MRRDFEFRLRACVSPAFAPSRRGMPPGTVRNFLHSDSCTAAILRSRFSEGKSCPALKGIERFYLTGAGVDVRRFFCPVEVLAQSFPDLQPSSKRSCLHRGQAQIQRLCRPALMNPGIPMLPWISPWYLRAWGIKKMHCTGWKKPRRCT